MYSDTVFQLFTTYTDVIMTYIISVFSDIFVYNIFFLIYYIAAIRLDETKKNTPIIYKKCSLSDCTFILLATL